MNGSDVEEKSILFLQRADSSLAIDVQLLVGETTRLFHSMSFLQLIRPDGISTERKSNQFELHRHKLYGTSMTKLYEDDKNK